MVVIKPNEIVAIRLREIMTIKLKKDDGNEVEGFGFYKQSIVLEKKKNLIEIVLLIAI